ncbi:hypothetical protein JCM10207_009313 [Rhodosporidiobolus poonsookiae]
MSLLRPFSALDLFEFNGINLDVWTETYGVNYYLSYLTHWGDLFSCVLSPCPSTKWGDAQLRFSPGSSSRRAVRANST